MTNKQFLLKNHGVSDYGWRVLRECERTLHKWAEDECNGRIQWDDETGEPHLYRKDQWGGYTGKGQPIFNKEDAALDRARKMAAHYGLKIYHQGDPRGCALYVYSEEEMRGSRYPIEQVYNTRATAIC